MSLMIQSFWQRSRRTSKRLTRLSPGTMKGTPVGREVNALNSLLLELKVQIETIGKIFLGVVGLRA